MKKITFLTFSASLLLLTGCCTTTETGNVPAVTVVKAAPGEIKFDGRLSEKFWAGVPAYELVRTDRSGLMPPLEKARILQDGLEKCSVKFACDDKYLYVAADLADNDLISMTKPGEKPEQKGDAFVFFLMPENAKYIWRFCHGPNGIKNALFHEIDGLYLEIKDKARYGIIPEYETACSLTGTLNKQNDRDKGWTTEMRLPLEYIAKKGVKFAPGEKWRIMVARYNYSAYNYYVQSSTFPGFPQSNLHLRQYYSPVIFR